MYIEKNFIPKPPRERISKIMHIILIILFIFFFFAFWNIQILKHNNFKLLALKNIKKTIELIAPRGLIIDNKGQIITENKINFTLVLRKENIRDFSKICDFISNISKIEKDILIKRYQKYKGYPESYAIPMIKNLSLREVILFKGQEEEYPEIEITTKPMRAYPLSNKLSHITGYISELSQVEYKEKKKYKLGDMIGKTGIEKEYEEFFIGTKGFLNVIMDNMNSIQKIVDEKKPVMGKTIVLTLDLDMQLYIEKLFKSYRGVVAVADIKTGGIVSMVSKPDYDPSFFISLKNEDQWAKLVNDPLKPLNNKFIQGLYSPGSTFKIVMTLLGLEEKIINKNTKISCTGESRIYGRPFHCWRPYGHGIVDVFKAVEDSCNIFFYNLGRKTNIETIKRYSELLGLGNFTGIDLPNEKKGLVPSDEWKQSRFGAKWVKGETISVSIGQGPLLVTPVQMMQMICTVAMRGKTPKLHFLKEIKDGDKVIKKFNPQFKNIPINPDNFEILIEGMQQCVEVGTAKESFIPKLDICGKTGTVQVITKENPNYEQLVKKDEFKPHAWFVSFAPKDNPKIAVVIFVENGGGASSIAVPIAKKVYQRYFNYER